MIWNSFKKAKDKISSNAMGPHTKNNAGNSSKLKDKFFGVGVNMMQKIAMKKMEKMSPQERSKMMQEAFNPKNKDKMLAVMENMRKSGQITQEQYNLAKQKLGM